MFIDHHDPDQLLSSVGAKHLVAEKHISLLWSEAVLFSNVSINISPLCGEGRICVWNFREDTRNLEVRLKLIEACLLTLKYEAGILARV